MKKPKYKVDDIVYCRPSKDEFFVFKCKVLQVKGINIPHYTLKIISGGFGTLHVKYENEMSKRPGRLISIAKKSIEREFGGYVNRYNLLKKELKKTKEIYERNNK